LRKLQAKMELKGCLSDEDLKVKEESLNAIRQNILELELKRESLWTGNLARSRSGERAASSEER